MQTYRSVMVVEDGIKSLLEEKKIDGDGVKKGIKIVYRKLIIAVLAMDYVISGRKVEKN